MAGLRSNTAQPRRLRANTRVDHFLTTTGLTGGSSLANVDGTTPVKFYRTAIRDMWVANFLVSIEDSAATATATTYGGLSALSNGLLVQVLEPDLSTVYLDLLDGRPIKSNAGWGSRCHDLAIRDFGSGDDLIQVRWSFEDDSTAVYVPQGYHFCVTVQDDLTGLTDHSFVIQGQMP